MEFKRKRPTGSIALFTGLAIVGGTAYAATNATIDHARPLACGAAIGVALLAAAIRGFRLPHRIAFVAGAGVEVAPRIGRPRTYRVRRVVPAPSSGRIVAEALVPVGVAVVLGSISGVAGHPLFLAKLAAIASIYGRWRAARRVDLEDLRGEQTRRIVVEPFEACDDLCDALAQRAIEAPARPTEAASSPAAPVGRAAA